MDHTTTHQTSSQPASPLENAVRACLLRMQVPADAIGSVSVVDGKALVVIEVDPSKASMIEPVRQQMEQEIMSVAGLLKAQVILTAEKKPETPLLSGVKQVIAIGSGKGGVGKSTVAVNLAAAAAQRGYKVGLLDADVYGPSLSVIMGAPNEPPPLNEGNQMVPPVAHGVKVMSIGFMVDPDRALVWRGPMVHSALMQMVRDVAWGELDALFIDMPPGTGDAQLTLAQMGRLTGAVIVSTPQDLALADARRAIAMFAKVNVPVLGLIENMSLYCCPRCGHEEPLFGHGGAKAEAGRLGVPFLGALPLALAVREASDSGTPFVLKEPESVAGKLFATIAEGLLNPDGSAGL